MHNIRPPISEKKFVDSDLDQTSGFRPTFADWFSLTADPLTASVALAVLTGLAKFSLTWRFPFRPMLQVNALCIAFRLE